MASLERLRKNRGVVRASVTRTITLLTDELQASVPDVSQVDSHITYLTQKNAELANLNKEIFDATDDDAYEEELEAAEEYDRKVSYAVSRARFFLREVANKTTETSTARSEATVPNADAGAASTSTHNEVSDSSPRGTDMTPSQGTVRRHRTVVLPKLQIPTFSDALRDWQSFWDHFSATIHLNEELLQIEKFKYLQSYLSGVAKRAIEGIRLTEDNYNIAIKTLTERFGRRDLLINERVDHLLALAPVKSSADVEKLRLFYDTVQFRVSALTVLGVSPDQYNVVLNRVLMKCLPNDLAILYRQKVKEAPQDMSGIATPEERARQVAEMLNFLRIQIEIREEGGSGRTVSAFSRLLPGDVEPPPEPGGHLSTASAFTAESVAVTGEACPLCNDCRHTIEECKVQLSADEKRARLRSARCCYRCGRKNHVARFCRRARYVMCSNCNRRHLTILCQLFRTVAPTPANATTANQDEPRITGRGTSTPPVTSAPSALSGVNAVLLQTGRVWAECGPRRRLVRILLDSGSQRTFIRRDLSKDLRCLVIGTEELSLVTFGHSKSREVMRSRSVALTLRGQRRDLAVTVEALEVPEVCTVTSPPINSTVLELLCDKNYDVADSIHPDTWNPQEVSVLLGPDVYWKVATGRIERLTSDLTAVETKFGWTVQGTMEIAGSSPTSALFLNCSPTSLPECDPSAIWRLDVVGVKPSIERKNKALPELQACEVRTVNFYGQTRTPLTMQVAKIPSGSDNGRLAERRLQAQLNRFKQEPELLKQNDLAVRAYFTKKHDNRVDERLPKENVHHMPHHAVIAKLRAVLDASAHALGHPSRKDVLLKATSLDADVVQLLIVFQCQPVVTRKFVGVGTPWWRGRPEPIIRLTKKALRRSLGRNSPNDEALTTLICEVEALINRRPLTYLRQQPGRTATANSVPSLSRKMRDMPSAKGQHF